MAGLNISDKVAPIKSTFNFSLRLVLFFHSAIVLLALYSFLHRQTNETIPLQYFRDVFHFLCEKNSLRKTFLVECLRSGAASCNRLLKAGILARNSRTSCLLIGRIIFLTREKTSFAIFIGRISFFTGEIRVKTIVRSSVGECS